MVALSKGDIVLPREIPRIWGHPSAYLPEHSRQELCFLALGFVSFLSASGPDKVCVSTGPEARRGGRFVFPKHVGVAVWDTWTCKEEPPR